MIIDTHGHTLDGKGLLYNTPVAISRMVEIMDQFDVQKVWVSSATALMRDFREANLRQYEATRPYADRFVNFYVVNPNFPELMEDDIRRSIEDRGFRGIKMHPWCTGFPVNDPVVHRAVELAIEYQVPILYHDGTPPWSETLQVAAVADYYPEAQIIIGHAGLFDAYRSAIEACNTHNNIWLCICGPCVGDAREIIEKTRKDRILFGSDFACNDKPDMVEERLKVVRLACPDPNLQHKIFWENPNKLMP